MQGLRGQGARKTWDSAHRTTWTSTNGLDHQRPDQVDDRQVDRVQFLTLADLQQGRVSSRGFCSRFARATNYVDLFQEALQKPIEHLLPSGRSTMSELWVVVSAQKQVKSAVLAFKQTWFCLAGSRCSDTLVVLGSGALLAAQPLTIR